MPHIHPIKILTTAVINSPSAQQNPHLSCWLNEDKFLGFVGFVAFANGVSAIIKRWEWSPEGAIRVSEWTHTRVLIDNCLDNSSGDARLRSPTIKTQVRQLGKNQIVYISSDRPWSKLAEDAHITTKAYSSRHRYLPQVTCPHKTMYPRDNSTKLKLNCSTDVNHPQIFYPCHSNHLNSIVIILTLSTAYSINSITLILTLHLKLV